jgi:4a-hydroxytetrahydrobiopterin dehydratase
MKGLTEEEVSQKLEGLSGWRSSGGKFLSKGFEFSDFAEALRFVNKVGEIAESIDHHPDIKIHDYKKVLVRATTHDVEGGGGLSEKDFELAKRIDEIDKS